MFSASNELLFFTVFTKKIKCGVQTFVIRHSKKAAKGVTEFLTDGTSVSTRNEEGKAEWREMKVGVFAKRKHGESAAPSEWFD